MSRLLTILSLLKLSKAKRIKRITVLLLLLVVGLEGGSYPAPFRTWKSSLPSPIILQATSVEMQVAATLSYNTPLHFKQSFNSYQYSVFYQTFLFYCDQLLPISLIFLHDYYIFTFLLVSTLYFTNEIIYYHTINALFTPH